MLCSSFLKPKIVNPSFSIHSSTDNFLSPIPVSDWSIFCCENLLLQQRERNENDETISFMMKKKKNPQKYLKR